MTPLAPPGYAYTAITIALILYLQASDVHQHSTFNRSWTATLLRGTDIRSRPSTKLSSI